MADDWMVAPCLDVLLAQANKFAPRRSKASDGSIGDQAHAVRNSEHNPKKLAFCPRPLVRARDFTHDPAGGFDAEVFVARLVALRDPRTKYIIWNWKIWYPTGGWKPYSGPNGHTHHCHVSVTDNPDIMSEAAWNIPVMCSPVLPMPPNANPAGRRSLSEGMVGEDVWRYAEFMNRVFPRYSKIALDNVKSNQRFGPASKVATMAFQRASNLAPDGVVGPQTYLELAKHGF